ncbi:MAG TPA: hypothetical protein VGG19_15235 [Tepidisphaeraceae bacterium]|jgi:hypothetical protein
MAKSSINQLTASALEAGKGILRLAPTWVPRSFLVPGGRLKLAPEDLYAFGTHRGGIDERWLSSTIIAMNENRTADEGLSYIVHGKARFTLKDAIEAEGARIIGKKIWSEFKRWPVFAKFFDNQGPIMHHMHPDAKQAKLVGQEAKPEAYYFPPQLNPHGGNFPYTFFGLEPGTTKADIRRCLERWEQGDNGILDYSKAYRLKLGTGWLVPPRVLHAPGSLLTFEPQWASDAFAMYQSMVEGRPVPWELLVHDVPKNKHKDLDYLVEMLDWPANTNPKFKDSHYLEPVTEEIGEGCMDKWIVYGKIGGRQLFSAKELTLEPKAKCNIRDSGAYGLIAVQGHGRIGQMPISSPAMIRFGEQTEDEFFVSHEVAIAGVEFENLSEQERMVMLRYFGPDANPNAPK